jgi:DNA-binding MarR family transcriptional regulator
VYRAIQTLIRNGLIEPHPHNSIRKNKILITPFGQSTLNAMLDIITEIDKEILSEFAVEEVLRLMHLLDKLTLSLKAI